MKIGVFFGVILAAMLVVPPAITQETAEEDNSSAASQQENAPAARQSSGVSRRRDPFRTLIVESEEEVDPSVACAKRAGKARLLIGQLQVQGTARSIDGTWIAVVDNNTGIAYFLRAEDELCNGTVSKINPDSVVFMEEATDALGRTSTREVVKRIPED